MSHKVDLLAIGAHPDDVEIGMGGTIAKYRQAGKNVVIVHLTEAGLSSNGTIETRQIEAENACKVLGISNPVQFQFPDRQLLSVREEAIAALVTVIRQYRPKLLFAPYFQDRHPDHGHCGEIVREAFFSSGIKKYLEDETELAYRPHALYFYQINGLTTPDFLVDISDSIDVKYSALACFKSQFSPQVGKVKTPLNSGFLEKLKARDQLLGNEVGVNYAEGFFSDKPILIYDLLGDKQ
ncbi:bacillithiol biosynthesis deacetylase BshB1 [Salipaludibacillus keqinensis]|uniref:Bacillithiol biosynthesis deacetylase BshB1 n=1 Tax=Salipaludibacillus keqinensis TaxID=2045207 RepID=A0A323TLB4_9BACI|nr:bacillithiol biosynthesis deacetylase BshB1 [Salipaludibacillus keqinensis]PYZ94537.1 bacillithiol biosynthesis deacetylase BshB1 [Salipaludibacillus keqinensis]